MALQQAAFVAPGVAPQAPFAPSAHPVAAPVTQNGAEGSSSFSMAAGGLVPVAALAMAGRARKGRRAQKARRGATLTQPPKLGKGFDTDKFSNVCDQTGITLARYVIEMQKQGLVDSEIALIMNSIREAVKVIAALVRKAPLKQAELLGLEGNINVQGEDQKKLDVITNDVLKNALRYTGKLGTMASEEEDAPVIGGEGVAGPVNQQVIGESGSYVCVFDPLDGTQAPLAAKGGHPAAAMDIGRDELVKGLTSSDAAARARAVKHIGEAGEEVAATMGLGGEVVRLLGDGNQQVLIAAMLVLGKIGAEGSTYQAEVARKLGANSEEVIIAACEALGLMGPAAVTQAEALLQAAGRVEGRARGAALRAIGSTGAEKFAKDVAEYLSAQDPEVQSGACAALGDLGEPAAPFAQQVAGMLGSQDKEVKLQALLYFSKMGTAGVSHVDAMSGCLADDDVLVRGAAAMALAPLGQHVANLAKDVAKHLASQLGHEKAAAAVVLGEMGEKAAAQFAPEIATLLSDKSVDTMASMVSKTGLYTKPPAGLYMPRVAATQALGKLGDEGCKYAEQVAALLSDDFPEAKAAAAEALGAMGLEGAKYEMEIIKLFEDVDVRVVSAAAAAVGLIGHALGGSNPSSIQAVVKLLRRQHPGVRGSAVLALGSMGDGVFSHMEKVLKCFHDRCGQVRANVIYALEKLGVRGQMYAADIVRGTLDADPKVRLAAVTVLGGFGDRGAACMEDLFETLGDPEPEVRKAALRTFAKFGSEAGMYLEAVEALFDDPVGEIKTLARETARAIS